jgi:Spy/CpxP family protein refolding chaperone
MIRFRSLMAGALVVAVLATGAAFAQGVRGGGPGRFGGPDGRGFRGGLPLASLNLTEAQQDLIRDIRERNRQGVRETAAKLQQAHEAQRSAVNAIPLNEGLIRQTTLALAEVEAEMAIQQARVQNEIFASLTAEQQAQVKQQLAERQARAEARRAEGQQQRQNRQNRQNRQ